jgi:hypothetical protein
MDLKDVPPDDLINAWYTGEGSTTRAAELLEEMGHGTHGGAAIDEHIERLRSRGLRLQTAWEMHQRKTNKSGRQERLAVIFCVVWEANACVEDAVKTWKRMFGRAQGPLWFRNRAACYREQGVQLKLMA